MSVAREVKCPTRGLNMLIRSLMKPKKARILVLEDDPKLRKAIVNYYKPRGYELVCHDDPSVALKQLAEAKDPAKICDVVISNLELSKVDGLELVHRIKTVAPELPIILVASDKNLDTAVEAVGA